MATRLEVIVEQTDFLLERQKAAQFETVAILSELIKEVEETLKKETLSEQDYESLSSIRKSVEEHIKKVSGEMQEDIDFLTEQLTALKHIASIPDQAKARELLNMIIDENEKLSNTEEFKKNIIEESLAAKQNLVFIIDDLKESLKEGKFKDVELLLDALSLEERQGQEELEDKHSCDGCDLGCGKNLGCGKEKGFNSHNIDIFQGIYDNDSDDFGK